MPSTFLLKCIYLLILSLCIKSQTTCSNNCADCDQSGNVCYACDVGYQMSVIGKCISDQTINKCIVYSPTNTCFACQPTFNLISGNCTKINSGCVSLNPADNSCFACDFGTVLINGICLGSVNCINSTNPCQQCSDGFALKNNICIDNSIGCKTADPITGICNQCQSGYSLIGYKCIKNSVLAYDCYIYNQKGECLICKNGYILTQTYCLLPSQIYDINNNKTTIQQILKQNQIRYSKVKNFMIIQTNLSQISNNQQNNSNTSPNNSNNFKTTLQNCQVIDPSNSSNCIICQDNFYLSKSVNKCLPVSQFCNGYDITNGHCFSCYYGLVLKNGVCNDPNCLIYNSSNICQKCQSLYILNSSSVCQYNDSNCQSIVNNRCDQCNNGYYVTLNGTCNILPSGCQFANVVTGTCLQCLQGYTINNNQCFLSLIIQNCNVTDYVNKFCTSCNYGYYWSGNICQQVSDLCNGYNIKNGKCLACIAGFKIDSSTGKCVDINCQQFDFNSNCIKCNQLYILDKSSKNITEGFCKLIDINCAIINPNLIACSKCNSGYYINTFGSCQMLPINCIGSATNGSCLNCASGFVLNQNRSCINSTILVSNNSQITQNQTLVNLTVINNTTVSLQDLNCLNYSTTLNQCLNCSNRYYISSSGKCAPVNPLCQNFSSNGSCTQCYQGYTVDNGSCGIAASTNPFCSNTTKNGTCLGCYKGFYLKAVVGCVPFNPLCKSSDQQTGQCTSCFQGYQLSNGSCSVFSKDPNCQFYNSNSTCINCSYNYYIDQSTGKCKAVSNLCKSYNSTNGNCIQCYQGYTLSTGACIIANNKTSDVNCQNSTNGTCSQCYSGFYLSNNLCKKTNLLCQAINPVNGNCTSCYKGYSLFNGNCVISNSTLGVDLNCKTFNTTLQACTQCYKGYFIDPNGVCQIFDPICSVNNQTNGKCLLCYPGYTLFNQTCQITNPINSSLNSDPFCIKVQGLNCLQCNNGYFLPTDTGICTQINPLCKNYSTLSGLCTQCYTGYLLNGGQCLIGQLQYTPFCGETNAKGVCVKCLDRYYLAKNATCQSVSILCDQYNPLTGECYTCIAAHVLQQNQCIYPALGVDPGCSYYTNSYCTACLTGFYLSNFRCVPVDQSCIKFDYQNNVCLNCQSNYTIQGANCV